MKKFIILLIVTFFIGVIPSLLVGNDVTGLILPRFYPPKILFPIMWSILYLLMTISVYLATKNSDDAYKIYFFQLIVNTFWTVIFFGLKLRLIAFIWIILLFILVIIMIKKFYKENKTAGLLQIPYIIWLLIAMYLNLSIYLLNM
jgi:translocator protein